MKHLATKERKRDREEFVHMFRVEIQLLIDNPHTTRHDTLRFVATVVRKFLGYNRKTNDCDIWTSINKTYHQLYNK